jgi:hypothetical protein
MPTKPDAILAAAQSIASQITTTDGRTPLERVLTRNWPMVSSWRNAGWTWRQIAALLTRGGVQLKGGGPVTERYLAAVASRIQRVPPRQPVRIGASPAGTAGLPRLPAPKTPPSREPTREQSSAFEHPAVVDETGPIDGHSRRDQIRERMKTALKSRAGN